MAANTEAYYWTVSPGDAGEQLGKSKRMVTVMPVGNSAPPSLCISRKHKGSVLGYARLHVCACVNAA